MNENTWRIRHGLLELIDSKGKVHSRFYFSPEENRFFHTEDRTRGLSKSTVFATSTWFLKNDLRFPVEINRLRRVPGEVRGHDTNLVVRRACPRIAM